MVPLVDMHCHLLAGLDDGPATEELAVEMCQVAWAQGTRAMAATAHINERYPEVNPSRIRQATARLIQNLQAADIGMKICPNAEIMVRPGLETAWQRGQLMGLADRRNYILIELPDGVYIDLRLLVEQFMRLGVRPVLTHPERHPEFLYESGNIEDLIVRGCVVQVSASSLTQPISRAEERAMRQWLERGIIHMVASDGHSARLRPPRLANAHRRIARWTDEALANQLCSEHPQAVMEGRSLDLPPPQPTRLSWLARLRERLTGRSASTSLHNAPLAGGFRPTVPGSF